MTSISRQIDHAVALTRNEEYLAALTEFLEVFGGEDPPSAVMSAKTAEGLSFFGLCLALVSKKYKPAIDLCKRAIALQFYNSDHHANLARVYVAAGNRKKAVETIEAGLKLHPEDEVLLAVRKELGIRARPAVPFLDRSHPINVSLGQARHAKKVAEKETRKKK